MTMQMVITRGLPASGKDTWALAWVTERPESRARVNRDELRYQMFGQYVLDGPREDVVTKAQHSLIEILFRNGRSIVVSDTNLRAATVKDFLRLARKYNAEVIFQDMETSLDECIRRAKARAAAGGRDVPEDVIRRFYARYFRKGRLPERPTLDDDPVREVRQYVPDESLPPAYIFDVDGTTMQNLGGRSFYDWSRVAEDTPVPTVIETAQRLKASGASIVVVSGRSAVCWDATRDSLLAAGMPIDDMYMRPAADEQTKDSIIKERILFNDIAPKWNVRGTFDDRNQVVRFWRDAGITCYQVQEGDF